MNVVLIGFMCSGKSRIGSALAKKLGWTHVDTDERILREQGLTIAELIRTRGEAAFRDIEKQMVAKVSHFDKSVISTGGGVPLNPLNMQVLASHGHVVWLKILPETVLKRAGNLKSRPLIDPANPLESIRKLMAEREKVYSQAPFNIEVENSTPELLADKIIGMLPPLS
ncbi:MAG: Shikimate kinase [Elusimicrobia bacterium]|nr:Shikimate kinase [Elusimicrobiota bacterium]